MKKVIAILSGSAAYLILDTIYRTPYINMGYGTVPAWQVKYLAAILPGLLYLGVPYLWSLLNKLVSSETPEPQITSDRRMTIDYLEHLWDESADMGNARVCLAIEVVLDDMGAFQ